MAAETKIGVAGAIAACDAVVDLMDAGTGAGYIEIRTGAAPTGVDDASSGTLLATCVCSDPAFGGAVDATPGGIATASAITDDSSADAGGTAAHFRGFDSNAVCRIQGTVGTSSADMIINNVTITIGAVVSITSWTVTMPES